MGGRFLYDAQHLSLSEFCATMTILKNLQGSDLMSVKKNYRNAVRSKKMIRQACLELLQEKPCEKITVTDIVARADLNRSTFYAHYPDICGSVSPSHSLLLVGTGYKLPRKQSRQFFCISSISVFNPFQNHIQKSADNEAF